MCIRDRACLGRSVAPATVDGAKRPAAGESDWCLDPRPSRLVERIRAAGVARLVARATTLNLSVSYTHLDVYKRQVLFWVLPLSAYRILMTWVYSRTHSLLVAQLMHASYTGWLLVLSPAISFAESPLWQIIFTASLWALVAAVGIFDRRWRREERPTAPRAV